jgi:nucleoside-diphosphate-sugar epimerase
MAFQRVEETATVKILLVGGAGMVGTFVTPYLVKQHELRVLDVRPPQHADQVEFVPGSISNPDDVARALDGMDSFVNMVMRNPAGANDTDYTLDDIVNNYEVNTVGLHILLWTAQAMGIKAGVHVSTRSVSFQHRRPDGRIAPFKAEETMPLDAGTVYGFTKGLGERICQHFADHFDMRLLALRITGPRTREAYLAERRVPLHKDLYVLDEEDLANAILAALEVVKVGRNRFDAVLISGDEHELDHNMTKARNLLGWAPQSQRYLEG